MSGVGARGGRGGPYATERPAPRDAEPDPVQARNRADPQADIAHEAILSRLRYLNHVADRFDLRRDIRFGTRVVAARYDEAATRR